MEDKNESKKKNDDDDDLTNYVIEAISKDIKEEINEIEKKTEAEINKNTCCCVICFILNLVKMILNKK